MHSLPTQTEIQLPTRSVTIFQRHRWSSGVFEISGIPGTHPRSGWYRVFERRRAKLLKEPITWKKATQKSPSCVFCLREWLEMGNCIQDNVPEHWGEESDPKRTEMDWPVLRWENQPAWQPPRYALRNFREEDAIWGRRERLPNVAKQVWDRAQGW